MKTLTELVKAVNDAYEILEDNYPKWDKKKRDGIAATVEMENAYAECDKATAALRERERDKAKGCQCSFRGRALGDGCQYCNPELAEEMRLDALADEEGDQA